MINSIYYGFLLCLVGFSFYGMTTASQTPMVLAGCGVLVMSLLMVANRGVDE